MNADQVVQYIIRLRGAAGAFVVEPSGGVLSKNVSKDFDERAIEAIVIAGLNVMGTLKAGIPGCFESRIDLTLMTVLIHDLDKDFLFILVDNRDEVAALRVAANVTSRHYQPGGLIDESKESPGSSKLFSLPVRTTERPERKKTETVIPIWG